MILAGALVGLGFLTKQLQAFLVLPGFAVAYLIAAPVSWRRRIRDGFLAVGALVLAAGWWVALVELVPASMRPYIGGSQNNSFLELTFGYNGLGRLTGSETGSVGSGPGPGGGGFGFSSQSGIGRMFASEAGGQIAWLIPAALLLLVAGLWLRGRMVRTDVARAALIVWGSWLLVTLLTFSLMSGIFHAYYTVALAPAIAALVAIGSTLLWERRAELWSLALLAVVTLATSGWAFVLLGRSADWLPWLRWAVLAAGVLGAVGLLAGHWVGARVLTAALVVAVLASLAGPTAYTLQTVATAHTGPIVTAGPTVAGGMPGGMLGGARGAMPGGMGDPGGTQGVPGVPPNMPGGTGAMPGNPPAGGTWPGGTAPRGTPPGGTAAGGFPGGGMGGILNDSKVGEKITTLLLKDADSYTWVAATVSSMSAASYQLATQKSVMPIGGFSGSDPSPTLAQFKANVAAGNIHYFIGGAGMGQPSAGSNGSAQILAWVKATFTAQTVDGTTVYDLTQSATTAKRT